MPIDRDKVEMRFRIDDQDHVDVPQSLVTALGADPDVRAKWERFTSGEKPVFSHYVASAKSPATAQRRVSEA